jgi:hypothetical protein
MPVIQGRAGDEGAVVTVLIGISAPRRQLLEKHALPVPSRVEVRALLDIGSALTGFDTAVFRQLDLLNPVGSVSIFTPSTGTIPYLCKQHRVSLSLPHDQLELHLPDIFAIEVDYSGNADYKALIGRDVLADCLLVYDGLRKGFT